MPVYNTGDVFKHKQLKYIRLISNRYIFGVSLVRVPWCNRDEDP